MEGESALCLRCALELLGGSVIRRFGDGALSSSDPFSEDPYVQDRLLLEHVLQGRNPLHLI